MRAAFVSSHANMRDFTAPYEFREYPKWVRLADGSRLLVENADEEAAALGEEAASAESVESLRDALMIEAKALGLNPHHKTGVEKLQQLINDAKS